MYRVVHVLSRKKYIEVCGKIDYWLAGGFIFFSTPTWGSDPI